MKKSSVKLLFSIPHNQTCALIISVWKSDHAFDSVFETAILSQAKIAISTRSVIAKRSHAREWRSRMSQLAMCCDVIKTAQQLDCCTVLSTLNVVLTCFLQNGTENGQFALNNGADGRAFLIFKKNILKNIYIINLVVEWCYRRTFIFYVFKKYFKKLIKYLKIN